MKESRELIFYCAVYEFDHNKPFKSTHSKIDLIFDLNSRNDLDTLCKILILVAPPGIHEIVSDESKNLEDYITQGVVIDHVGVSPEKTKLIICTIQAQ